MSGEPASNRSMHGSYVQLQRIDEKEDGDGKVYLSSPPPKRFLCTRRDAIVVSIALVSSLVLIASTLAIGLPKIQEKRLLYEDTGIPESAEPLRTFQTAVVVTDGKPCAAIGRQALKNGGSAVDAAIATLFCNGVVNPQSMGLGGGFFMTIYSKERNVSEVLDAREMAPEGASRDMYNGNATLSQEGGLSIAVPGELRGYEVAHRKYGTLPWKQLVEPSIAICENGFTVTHHLADKLQMLQEKILNNPSMREEFVNETGDVYKEGDLLKRPVLARTLREIANRGADVLYAPGELRDSFLKDIQECGGVLTSSDLEKYEAFWRSTIKVDLSHPEPATLHSVPPPASGSILAFILNVLDGYKMNASDVENVDRTVLTYHRIIEAFKFGFALRTQLGDDRFVNTTELVSNLLSKEYAESVRNEISDATTFPVRNYKPVMEDAGTAHVSVIAPNGDAVSVTSTINTYFGSLCRSPSTGIILNNGMDDFSSRNITNYFGVPPSPANTIEKGKRPLSSMCPSVLVDQNGDVKMVVGGAGGTRIITASALGVIQILWLGRNVKQATDAPRLHHQLFPTYIEYEKNFPRIYLDRLGEYGHSAKPESQASVFLGIVRQGDTFQTNVDHRKGGSAEGF